MIELTSARRLAAGGLIAKAGEVGDRLSERPDAPTSSAETPDASELTSNGWARTRTT